jgi:hypothetical protein
VTVRAPRSARPAARRTALFGKKEPLVDVYLGDHQVHVFEDGAKLKLRMVPYKKQSLASLQDSTVIVSRVRRIKPGPGLDPG